MFDASSNGASLERADEYRPRLSREVWVFTERLKAAATKGSTGQIQVRPKQYGELFRFAFRRQMRSNLFDEIPVE